MRPTRDLRRLRRASLARVNRLAEHAFDAATTAPDQIRHDQLTAYCVVEMYNLWYAFSRSLFISVCVGTRDAAGKITLSQVPRAATDHDALTHAIRRCKPNRLKSGGPPWQWIDEPSWASPGVLLDSLDEVGAANRPAVSAALSVPSVSQTVLHLPKFRHFYAHRGEGTRRQAISVAPTYALPTNLTPTGLLNSHGATSGVTRPQPILMDWIDDIEVLINIAI